MKKIFVLFLLSINYGAYFSSAQGVINVLDSNSSFVERRAESVSLDIENLVAGLLSTQIEQAGFNTFALQSLNVSGLLNGTDIR